MKFYKLKQLQFGYGYEQLQALIDTGSAWSMEGAIGRAAMDALKSGACFLPTSSRKDYYGNVVPSRYQVKKGTAGSYANSVRFYSQLEV
jgi:hypothetical protein